MKTFKIFFIFFLIATICVSCKPKTNKPFKQISETKTNISNWTKPFYEKRGSIIEKVNCFSDTNMFFSLYLPSGFDSTLKYPVIIAFDAEARAMYSIKRLYKVAEKYNYIVVSSYNFRNNLPQESNDNISKILLNDIPLMLPIDRKRIYLSGFSGGARFSSEVAVKHSEIAGVIGCSAGFSQLPSQSSFVYIGIAGKKDFNYSEMKEIEMQLESNTNPHLFIYHNGDHEWADVETLDKALLFLNMNSYKNKIATKNTDEIKLYQQNQEKRYKQALTIGNKSKAYQYLDEMILFLNGLIDVNNYKKELELLKKDLSVQRAVENVTTLLENEKSLKQNYSQQFSNKNEKFWQQEISKLNSLSQNKNNPEEDFMYIRVKAYIALMSHIYFDRSLKENDLDGANIYGNIKIAAEPEKGIGYFLLAEVYSIRKDNESAKKYIAKAIQKGFYDIQKFREQESFRIFTNSDYNKFVEEIEKNALR